jgi:hypothetical protein
MFRPPETIDDADGSLLFCPSCPVFGPRGFRPALGGVVGQMASLRSIREPVPLADARSWLAPLDLPAP